MGLLAFLFQLIKSIIFFFTGQKFFPELPEDKELRLMREAEEAKNNPQPQPQPQPQVNNQPYQGGLLYEETYDEDDFLEEPTGEAPLPRQQATIEEVVFEEEPREEVSPIQAPVEEKPAPIVQEVNRPEPEPSKELLHEEDSQDDFLDPFDVEEQQAEEEELEVYQPKGTTDDTYSIDEDDTDSGVNINFDDWGKR